MEKKFEILIVDEGDERFYSAIPADEVELSNAEDCYDRYGQHYDEDAFEPCEAYTYWDGSNWRTMFIDDDCGAGYLRADEETAAKVVAEYSTADFVKTERGVETWQSEHYTFFKSHWQGNPFVFQAIEKE